MARKALWLWIGLGGLALAGAAAALGGGDGAADGRIIDLTGQTPTDKRKASRMPWAVVLHQMGFSRGSDPTRYLKTTAHFIVLPDGTVAQLHPITARINASDGFNEGGIAIEFAGNFPSSPGSTDPSRFWNPDKMGMDQLTPQQVEAGRWLLAYLRDQAMPAIGGELTTVLAHRQSGEQRQNDPGPDVWANVGEWSVRNMGLSDGGPGFTVTDGNPILASWREAPLIA